MAFLKQASDVGPDKRTGFTYKGEEIVLAKIRGRPKGGLVAKGIQKGMFPDEKKVEAASIYAVTGSVHKASELTGVPLHTIKSWRQTDEFKALLNEVWTENNEKIDARFTAIIEKSLEAIIDRLDNGDHRLTAKGTVVRVPIGAKELSLVQAINVDKRQLLRGLPTSRTDAADQGTGKAVDRLERLAETFENLARLGRKPEVIDVSDAEIINYAESKRLGDGGGGIIVSTPEGHQEGQIQGRTEWRAAETTSETTDKSA